MFHRHVQIIADNNLDMHVVPQLDKSSASKLFQIFSNMKTEIEIYN